MQTTGEYLQSGFSILKSKLFLLQVFHYWVDQPGGQQRSENATLITGEQPPTMLHLITKDKDIMAKDKHTELVIRPELNCLYQEEEELTIALNGHYHFPPPEKPTQNSIIIENTAKGTIGASHYRSLQDEFLDEFIFKGQVKDGFFVEAGADDFMLNTNTLYFERLHGWTGLLVEPVLGRFHSGWV